ncbi:hypothetical protein F5Y19DRAFT_483305 [Xylariaceae sp. FL1651]|nr:hypothetical protein F5Y19DRAFT_483305 [Xylariaceae sp. FL1651]
MEQVDGQEQEKAFHKDTHIDRQDPSIVERAQSITDIETKNPEEISDAGVIRENEDTRVINKFHIKGRYLAKIKFQDNGGSTYGNCKNAARIENTNNQSFGNQPSLETVKWVIAQILLACAGQIGGRTRDGWKKARDLAKQELYLNPGLETRVKEQMQRNVDIEDKDVPFTGMLRIVKQVLRRNSCNAYYQAERGQYTVDQGLLYHIIDTDIVMVVNQADQIITFQIADAFDAVFARDRCICKEVVRSIKISSSFHRLPVPNMTRHGSGCVLFGGRCEIGDADGKKGIYLSKDLLSPDTCVNGELQKFDMSALGACTEVTSFFELGDPTLLDEYKAIAVQISKFKRVPFQTRLQNDPFVMKAVLVNLMTNDHRDRSDCKDGLAGLIPLGDFEGGDLLLGGSGIRIESKPGCVQLVRGREIHHYITKWTGHRFFVVNTNHEATVSKATPSTEDTCLGVDLEDINQVLLSEKERIPERHIGLETSSSSNSTSEVSMDDAQAARNVLEIRKRTRLERNLSDASAE